ncbi:hypothetical protein U1Q18_041711 [Sarracenia purpurea var. burkii]
MALTGKIERQVEIKSNGDIIHELFGSRPHHINTMSTGKIHGCVLQEGEWGTVGSVVVWDYTHDGKQKTKIDVVETIDEKNKIVTFKLIGGDLTELYKSFKATVHVETKGESNLLTWTFEYEKLNAEVEDPNTLLDFIINVSKDIEEHHLKQ